MIEILIVSEIGVGRQNAGILFFRHGLYKPNKWAGWWFLSFDGMNYFPVSLQRLDH
ncbi:hypothetical protein [Rhizobium sp. BK602]|uniref:hypothetical protein n=1 Tax=Rhizobium sp. BK602 TaxID=2586986 RepID=UPI00161DEBEE|nr:hypothetical protein [Rhizobium sp. BK602]MBB3612903.1 hypothetical protein [Rhizobium sp. BK602]